MPTEKTLQAGGGLEFMSRLRHTFEPVTLMAHVPQPVYPLWRMKRGEKHRIWDRLGPSRLHTASAA